MEAWEYCFIHGEILGWEGDRIDHTDISLLSSMIAKGSSEVESVWDQVENLGENGWEMVNAFPVARFTMGDNAGYTSHVVFVFKRRKE